MTQEDQHLRVDYLEIPALDLEATKAFYSTVFGWTFTDYGPEYTSFADGRLRGGFVKAEAGSSGGVLVVVYSKTLEETQAKITGAGGAVVRETFEFPGGRRFHFADPSGNELAVWSDR